MASKEKKLRSREWFGREGKDGFIYRAWMKNQGIPSHEFDGRPIIGICNTWSELTPCNGHFRELAEFVKRGVYEAGGFPLEFPVMSPGETQMRPTAMLFRNLASMEVEESIRGNPLDGVVLLMGCDKTTPALLMGAASCDLPTIGLSGGPMLSGKWRGGDLGSGTGVWKMSEMVRAGEMSAEEFVEAESNMHRSKGHCMTMGTASTMAAIAEALGMALPGTAAIPAVHADRLRASLAQALLHQVQEGIHRVVELRGPHQFRQGFTLSCRGFRLRPVFRGLEQIHDHRGGGGAREPLRVHGGGDRLRERVRPGPRLALAVQLPAGVVGG